MKNIQLYSITYSQGQPCEYDCYDNSHIRTVEQRSYLFEWNPIVDIVDNKLPVLLKENPELEYLGVFSWKFSLKTGIFRNKLYWLIENNPNNDVYIFCRKLRLPYLLFTEKVHPGFTKRFTYILDKLNIPFVEPEHTVYSNFFVAKIDVYRDFVNSWIKPVINLMEEDQELRQMCFEPCNYKSLSPEQLQEFTGLNYWTFHTFLLERMFSMYLETRKDLRIWKP